MLYFFSSLSPGAVPSLFRFSAFLKMVENGRRMGGHTMGPISLQIAGRGYSGRRKTIYPFGSHISS